MRRKARGLWVFCLSLVCLSVLSGSAAADKIKHSVAIFSGLDKITGRIISFEVGMNETVQFGALLITDHVCYTRPPTEAPQTDTFVQIDVVDADKTMKRIFSGWMFAASPGLNALDQPVYDIWLTGCKGKEQLIASPPTTASTPEPEEAPQVGAGTSPPAAAAVDAAATAPPSAKPVKFRHSHHRIAAPPPDNAPVDVGPPPGMQMPPNNGGDNSGNYQDQTPPMGAPSDQNAPDNQN